MTTRAQRHDHCYSSHGMDMDLCKRKHKWLFNLHMHINTRLTESMTARLFVQEEMRPLAEQNQPRAPKQPYSSELVYRPRLKNGGDISRDQNNHRDFGLEQKHHTELPSNHITGQPPQHPSIMVF